jgi:hypothetical protein
MFSLRWDGFLFLIHLRVRLGGCLILCCAAPHDSLVCDSSSNMSHDIYRSYLSYFVQIFALAFMAYWDLLQWRIVSLIAFFSPKSRTLPLQCSARWESSSLVLLMHLPIFWQKGAKNLRNLNEIRLLCYLPKVGNLACCSWRWCPRHSRRSCCGPRSIVFF